MICVVDGCDSPAAKGKAFCSHHGQIPNGMPDNPPCSNREYSLMENCPPDDPPKPVPAIKPRGKCQHPQCGQTVFVNAESGYVSLYCSSHDPTGGDRRVCLLPNCNTEVWKNPKTGELSLYCTKPHQAEGEKLGLKPPMKTQVSSTPGICAIPGCNKPVWEDKSTGRKSLYCSRGHAAEGASGSKLQKESHKQGICALPGCDKPVYEDKVTGKKSLYCTFGHMNLAAAHGSSSSGVSHKSGICALPGCDAPVSRNFKYCSKKHGELAASKGSGPSSSTPSPTPKPSGPLCVVCNVKSAQRDSEGVMHEYCSKACAEEDDTPGDSSRVRILKQGYHAYDSVLQQFTSKWSGTPPAVVSISKVMVSKNVYSAYEAYRNSIIKRGVRTHGHGDAGNTQRRFHGTAVACSLGYNGNNVLCSNPSCGQCGVIRNGFLIRYSRSGLYGKGLYFTSRSTKSNGYNRGGPNSTMKCMFLCHVVVGKGYKSTTTMSGTTSAPSGYDSILGEHNSTNDECIVYCDAAAIPAYLIVYKP